MQWQSITDPPEFEVLHAPDAAIHRQIKSLSKGFRNLIIDCPPALGDITGAILKKAHLAVIPVGPSPLDIWSSRETVALVAERMKKNRRLAARLIICKKISRTRVAKEAGEIRAVYKELF